MDSDKYLEGQSMQRPPLFESDGFIYWKTRFETYVKSKDLDLWHIIINGLYIQNWRAKVTAIEESKDLSPLALDELIEEKKSFRQRDDKKRKSDRKCFRCGDPNHLIGECPKSPRNKERKAFVGGSWSDSENEADDKTNEETCLMAQSSNKVCLRIGLEPDEWIKDISCSKHMIGNKSLFSTYKAYDGGNVVFGSNLKGKIIGKGTVSNESLTISNVEHIGYPRNSKAYIILNKHTMKFEESLNVTFNESPPPTKLSPLVDDDVGEEVVIERKVKVDNNVENESIEVDEVVNIRESKSHPLEQVIGNLNERTLRSQAQNKSNFFCFISMIEHKNVNEALGDESWVVVMQEKLNQFIANDVWDLVHVPRTNQL
ncbi:retrovirus-related pol polyprotein from transposon TNT 1-94 [Tanacetum coccineum]